VKSEKHPNSDDWYMPPDIGSFLGPVVLVFCLFAAMHQDAMAKVGGNTALFRFVMLTAGLGVGLLFLARWPLYRQGRIFSYGPRHLDRLHRNLYFLAYLFIVPSILFLTFLTVFLR
jgi:hypothetical protein